VDARGVEGLVRATRNLTGTLVMAAEDPLLAGPGLAQLLEEARCPVLFVR
jgi:hypothetical protein